jgi:ABC-2 type transport system permease protein
LQHVAAWNPVTYILEGLRSLAMRGWNAHDLAAAALAIAVVAVLSMAMCFKALDGRVKQR